MPLLKTPISLTARFFFSSLLHRFSSGSVPLLAGQRWILIFSRSPVDSYGANHSGYFTSRALSCLRVERYEINSGMAAGYMRRGGLGLTQQGEKWRTILRLGFTRVLWEINLSTIYSSSLSTDIPSFLNSIKLIYRKILRPVILYASETFVMTNEDVALLKS